VQEEKMHDAGAKRRLDSREAALPDDEVAMSKRPSPPPPQPPDVPAAKDPLVEAQIERSLRPYVGRVPPKALALMRANLEEALTTHPVATTILNQRREHEHPPVKVSGPQPIDAADDDDEAGGMGAS
jgi:hypothetical protein